MATRNALLGEFPGSFLCRASASHPHLTEVSGLCVYRKTYRKTFNGWVGAWSCSHGAATSESERSSPQAEEACRSKGQIWTLLHKPTKTENLAEMTKQPAHQPYSLSLKLPPSSHPLKAQTHLKLPLSSLRTSSSPLPQLSCGRPSSSVCCLVDCAHNRPCRSAFSIPPGAPPSKAASHLLVSFRSPGLSCASCPAQSGPWQGGASLWNHTSQLFTLGSRHPTPLPFLCSAPPPRPTLPLFYTECQWLLFGGKKKKKKKNGRKRGIQRNKEATARWACFIGFGGTVGTAVPAEVTAEAKVEFHPELHFSFIVSFTGPGKSDARRCQSAQRPLWQKPFLRDDMMNWDGRPFVRRKHSRPNVANPLINCDGTPLLVKRGQWYVRSVNKLYGLFFFFSFFFISSWHRKNSAINSPVATRWPSWHGKRHWM